METRCHTFRLQDMSHNAGQTEAKLHVLTVEPLQSGFTERRKWRDINLGKIRPALLVCCATKHYWRIICSTLGNKPCDTLLGFHTGGMVLTSVGGSQLVMQMLMFLLF